MIYSGVDCVFGESRSYWEFDLVALSFWALLDFLSFSTDAMNRST